MGGEPLLTIVFDSFLENLEKNRTNFSDSIATLAEAQVRFFRGVTCFNLAKCYGGQYIIYRQLPVLGEKIIRFVLLKKVGILFMRI